MSDGRPEGMTADSWQESPHNRWAYQHIEDVLPTVTIPSHGPVLDLVAGEPLEVDGLDAELTALATDAILVLRGREVVLERYFNGMTSTTRHLLQSVTKSICSAVFGQFVTDGLIDVRAPIGAYVPDLRGSAYEDALVQHALDMTVAVAYDETYDDPGSDVNRHDRSSGWKAPQDGDARSIREFLATLPKNGEHGRSWQYCSANTDVLAWVLEEVSGRRFTDLFGDFWSRMGAEHDALMTVDVEGFSLASGGGCVTLRDLARFGRVLLEDGQGPGGAQAIPLPWIDDIRRGASDGVDYAELPANMRGRGSYRNQFWRPGDDDGSFFGVGIYGQYVWVDPRTDVVVAKLSSMPDADDTQGFEDTCAVLERLSVLATGRP